MSSPIDATEDAEEHDRLKDRAEDEFYSKAQAERLAGMKKEQNPNADATSSVWFDLGHLATISFLLPVLMDQPFSLRKVVCLGMGFFLFGIYAATLARNQCQKKK